MLKSLPVIAAVFTLGIIILIAFAVLVIKSRRRYSVSWKVGGVPAKSTCCHAPTRPLGWTADGWVASCKACGAWQYLGDDFDNPPPGFQQRDAAVNSKPYAGSDDEVIPFKGYARGGLVDPSGRPEVTSAPSIADYQFQQSGDICRMLNCDEPIVRLGLCQHHWDWLNAIERLEEDADKPRERTLIGYTNAVKAAEAAIRALGGDTDHESFERLAELRGNAPVGTIRDGFVVLGFEDVQRLCDTANIVVVQEADGKVHAYDPVERVARTTPDEGEPLTSPPMPNVGGEGHPDYQGPHYESSHEQPTRFVPYDMLNEPIPGTGVVRVGKVACVGPFPIEGQGDEDTGADKS